MVSAPRSCLETKEPQPPPADTKSTYRSQEGGGPWPPSAPAPGGISHGHSPRVGKEPSDLLEITVTGPRAGSLWPGGSALEPHPVLHQPSPYFHTRSSRTCSQGEDRLPVRFNCLTKQRPPNPKVMLKIFIAIHFMQCILKILRVHRTMSGIFKRTPLLSYTASACLNLEHPNIFKCHF